MKIGKRLLLFMLLAALLLGSVFSVSAEETDWSNVDWTDVDWYAIDYNQVDWESTDIGAMIRAMYSRLYEDTEGKRLSRFWDWAENQASWHVVFLISMHTDGASSEAVFEVIYDRFSLDPYAMIQALAKETDSAVRDNVTARLCYGLVHPWEFNQLLAGIRLPDNATAAEWDILVALLREAPEIDWNGTDWSQIDWSTMNIYKVDWDWVDWERTDVQAMFRQQGAFAYRFASAGFSEWLHNEAELSEVLLIYKGSDGAYAQMCACVLYDYFVQDPYAVVQAIAREEDALRRYYAAGAVVFGADYPFDELSQILGSKVLPETATDAERTVWADILSEAERQWNVVPTGDTIAIPAALLLASCCGLVLLIGKKRCLVD